jgi:predicted PurR-regulated permease PerM
VDRKSGTLLILSAALLLASSVVFLPVAKTFLFAATLSVVLVPPMSKLESRLWGTTGGPKRRILLAMAVTLSTLLGLFLVVGLAVFIFVRNFQVLEEFGTRVAAWVERTSPSLFGTTLDLQARAGESLDQLLGYVQGTFVATAGVLVDLIIFTSVLYIFLRHGPHIRRAIREALPAPEQALFDRFARVTHSSLFAIYVVHMATALITVVLALPFFWLIGFGEHLLFWSFLCGAFQLIPVLGPSMIMIGIAIFSFTQGENVTAVLVLSVGYPLVGGFPDLVIRPLLLRGEMKMDAAILILGFFAGIVSMGMIGFVLGPLLLKLLVEALQVTREALAESTSSHPGH